VFLAAIARETTHLKLIPTFVCLPLHDPVRLFEDLAMVDAVARTARDRSRQGHHAIRTSPVRHEPDEASARAPTSSSCWCVRETESCQRRSAFYDFLELKLPGAEAKPHPPLWTAATEAAGNWGHNFVAPFTITEAVRAVMTSCGQQVA
jgi:hypothetical protein